MHDNIRSIFQQASAEIKSWPKWMQQPEMRNMLKNTISHQKNTVLTEQRKTTNDLCTYISSECRDYGHKAPNKLK